MKVMARADETKKTMTGTPTFRKNTEVEGAYIACEMTSAHDEPVTYYVRQVVSITRLWDVLP